MGWPRQWGEPGDCYEERGKKPVLTVLHSKELHVKAAFLNHGPQTSSIILPGKLLEIKFLGYVWDLYITASEGRGQQAVF